MGDMQYSNKNNSRAGPVLEIVTQKRLYLSLVAATEIYSVTISINLLVI